MRDLNICFVDFWQGHDPVNNILTNMIRDIFECSVVPCDPDNSDLNIVTIYGNSHLGILDKYRRKSLLWLGENKRPNLYNARYSISFDFSSYGGTNHRLPLWYSEIDWYNSGLGVISVDELTSLTIPGSVQPDHIAQREFCIAVFNNPEGLRMQMLNELNRISPVKGYGRPFGNWFPTYETYQAKLAKLGQFTFNFCPENSFFPGYYTEKCFHAKVANTIPIYMADTYVKSDFRPRAFINAYDYKSTKALAADVYSIFLDKKLACELINQPLLHAMPSLDETKSFLKYAVNRLLLGR